MTTIATLAPSTSPFAIHGFMFDAAADQKGLATMSTITTPVIANSVHRNSNTPRSLCAEASSSVTLCWESASASAWARRFRRGAIARKLRGMLAQQWKITDRSQEPIGFQ